MKFLIHNFAHRDFAKHSKKSKTIDLFGETSLYMRLNTSSSSLQATITAGSMQCITCTATLVILEVPI